MNPGITGVAFAILAEAGLSFLGVGVQPPSPTWGGMLSKGLPLINRAVSGRRLRGSPTPPPMIRARPP